MDDKLLKVQSELKAGKSQWNKFGKYNYRSCDDILEAVKPLLKKYNLLMTISDTMINVGNYNYIQSAVEINDIDSDKSKIVHAYAREADKQSGMADAQITGSTSSYARKYALNGMFLIDDTKDADTMDNSKTEQIDNTDKYTDMTLALEDCSDMDALKNVWRNVWTDLANDNYGKEHMTTVYNKCKQDLSK